MLKWEHNNWNIAMSGKDSLGVLQVGNFCFCFWIFVFGFLFLFLLFLANFFVFFVFFRVREEWRQVILKYTAPDRNSKLTLDEVVFKSIWDDYGRLKKTKDDDSNFELVKFGAITPTSRY